MRWGDPCRTGTHSAHRTPCSTQETPSAGRDQSTSFPRTKPAWQRAGTTEPRVLPHARGNGGAATAGGLVEAGRAQSAERLLPDSGYVGDQQAGNSRVYETEMQAFLGGPDHWLTRACPVGLMSPHRWLKSPALGALLSVLDDGQGCQESCSPKCSTR